MAGRPSSYRKTLVEECEVSSVSTATGNLGRRGITLSTAEESVAVSGGGSAVPNVGQS